MKITEPWFDETERKAVAEVLASGQLIQAGRVQEFERLFAAEVGAEHAVMVSSGTAALHLVMLACDIGPGDAVAIPDFTFVATANAVALTGATPIFVDVSPDTYNMDIAALRALVDRMAWAEGTDGLRLRIVMPVHQFGLPAEMDAIAALTREHGLLVVEDAACALGSRYRGRPMGTWGAASCFSFHPRKVITTGEGGAVVTNDARLADRLRALRAHGFAPLLHTTELVEPGLNYRMTEMQAAMGLGQMEKLPTILERRRRLAHVLSGALADVTWFASPAAPSHVLPNWQSYVGVLAEGIDRGRIMKGLMAQGIESRPGATALHRLKVYRERPAPTQASCPVSATLDERALALPLHPLLKEEDITRLATALRTVGPA